MQRKKKNKLMQIRLDSETYQKIKDTGEATGMTASQFARIAIMDKLDAPDIQQRLDEIEKQLKQQDK